MKNRILLLVLIILLISVLAGCGVVPPLNQSPTASFTASPTSGVAPLEVFFDASGSYDPDGNIVSYEWDFKDGNTGSGKIVNHTFSSAGNYDVRLIVTDDKGATDSTTKTINVTETLNQPPIASFTTTPASGVAPLEVYFNASNSYDSDGMIISYAWDFKDGNTGNGQTISHTFVSTGNYDVKLTITDNEGATDSATKTITVTETLTFCKIGVPYIADDGLTVVLNSLSITEKIGSYQYTINYTLTNNTSDKVIDEGAFKMYYKNEGGGLPQYGFFGKLFPGDTKNRTYTFEELKSKPFDVLEYSSDNFFSTEPLINSLKWEVPDLPAPSYYVLHAPVITSIPGDTAIVGVEYVYEVKATDPDGDVLFYSLITKPEGMAINSAIVSWVPTEGQIGVGNFTVKVSDGQLSVTQSFGIIVKAVEIDLIGIEVSPDTMTLFTGESQPLEVIANYNNGTSANVTSDCTYSAEFPILSANVDNAGVVTAVGVPGEATITVTYEEGGITVIDLVVITVTEAPLAVGGTGPAGGHIFYDKGYYSSGWRYLEVAPASTEWYNKQWGSDETLIGGTETGIGTGQSNTTIIVTWLNSHSETGQAAQLCNALVYGGYDDWFLPSQKELNLMYENLHLFGVGGFAHDFYWSSSEISARHACSQFFDCGDQFNFLKLSMDRVRAVRAF